MRLVGFVAVGALLSGCSFLEGGYGAPGKAHPAGFGHANAAYGAPADPCQIPYAQAPIPRGCHPAQVSIGTGHPGGFAQQPQFGAPQLATGGYGGHAAGNPHAKHLRGGHAGPVKRRPRFRGALDIGAEKSMSGDLIDNGIAGIPSAFDGYDASLYPEGAVIGSPPGGEVRNVLWTTSSRPRGAAGDFDVRNQPNISFGDAWHAPTTIGVSGEYILNDRATVFGRAGYAHSEGTDNTVATQEGTIYQDNLIDIYDRNVYQGTVDGGTFFRPNTTVAQVSYDFSDMRRLDLEAGGRLYLDPVAGKASGQTITPFIGASAGASRYNAVSYTRDTSQLFYSSAIGTDGVSADDEDLRYYDLENAAGRTPTEIYDAQWVPRGGVQAGVEWQLTPATALAFETGVRVEGAREYSNGQSGDTNVTVPFTLRGSFNF